MSTKCCVYIVTNKSKTLVWGVSFLFALQKYMAPRKY